jgi:hypothetical protein
MASLDSVHHVSGAHDELADRPLSEPSPLRLAVDQPRREEMLAAHARAMAADDAGYLDPVSGLFVLTARYHAERGHCCEQGCRHCPYVEDELPRDEAAASP